MSGTTSSLSQSHADDRDGFLRRAWRLLGLRLLALIVLSTWAAGCASLPSNVTRTPSRSFAAPEQTALGQLTQAHRARAKASAESGFYLLASVDAAFSSRLALVEAAQRSLDLQYYAIHADASTEVLLQRIREAARRGVRVRILLDDFNTVGADAQVLRLAFEPGIELRLFNPIAGSRSSLLTRILGSLDEIGRIQKRMHNKLFIADSAWGITGGRNLGDAYFGGDGKSAFVDLDVLATGSVVRAMATSFDRYWNDELAYPAPALLSPQDLERLRKPAAPAPATAPREGGATPVALTSAPAARSSSSASAPAAPMLPQAPPISVSATVLPDVTASAVLQAQRELLDLQRIPLTWAPAALLVDKPEKVEPGDADAAAGATVVDGLLGLMEQAREEVLIVSPYFVPGARMLVTFERLRARGIRVRVLTNSLASNDAPAAHAGYARWRPRLLRLGVELHEMRADPATAIGLAGSGGAGRSSGSGSGSGAGSGVSFGSAVGGSKEPSLSRASLHAKAVVVDRRLVVIGSMNLDLRSQVQNSEVALVIRSTPLARQAAGLIDATFARGAYRVLPRGGSLLWQAPPGAAFGDSTSEPEASLRLRLLVNVIGPFAPDEML